MKKKVQGLSGYLLGIGLLAAAGVMSGCGAGGGASSATMTETTAAAATWAAGDAGAYEDEGAYPAEEYYEEEKDVSEKMEANDLAGTPMENTGKSSAPMAGKYRQAYGPEDFNTEEYSYISENGYKSVAEDPLSTFSVDVDTASYGNVRRMIRAGGSIPADAVRIEELINYFDYDYPQPKEGEPFAVTTEYGDCPWNEGHRLLMVGLQAKDIDFEDRPASNFVFLLDVSGSMYSDDKLPLVQKAFAMLAENLTADDRVSIVTYAGYESVVLDGVPGSEKAKIVAALEDLEAGGSTAGEAGIQKAYALAEKNFIPGGNNRVILRVQ